MLLAEWVPRRARLGASTLGARLVGSESEQMIGAIERERATFQSKTEVLDAARLRRRIDPSAVTLGASSSTWTCDLIEEYARPTGRADLLREALDGSVGEEPPASWQPRGFG
jgi:hypothetical protein